MAILLTTNVDDPNYGVNKFQRRKFQDLKEQELQTTNPAVAEQTPKANAQGQPLEVSMVGTNDNAAPKKFVQNGVPPKPRQQAQATAPVPKATPEQMEEALLWADAEARKNTAPKQDTTLEEAMSESKGVSANAIQPTKEEVENALIDEMVASRVPDTPPTALPTDTTPKPNYAVPTAEERQAWSAQKSDEPTLMAQALEDAAAATDDPKQKALYSMAAERMREYEGWQEEENAYRRGQARTAREMRDRLRTAAQRRDQREYNDQDPSWADTMRKVPMVQNTIGVRRYNPETGEMEWHYPRNAAEGIGALLTNIPMIGHAILTGDNRLQRDYRAMEQNQMFAPYRMDYADMEDYRKGNMAQPQLTWSDKVAADIGASSFSSLKKMQELQGIEATAEYIGAKYGPEMKNAYIKAELGVKEDANATTPQKIEQAITAYEYAMTDPDMVGSEAMGLLKLQLVEGMASDKIDAATKARIATLLGRSRIANQTAADATQIKGGKNLATQPAEYSPEVVEEIERILDERNKSGDYSIDTLVARLPTEAQKELNNIIRQFESYVSQYPNDEAGAKNYLKQLLTQSGLVNAQGFTAGDMNWRTLPEVLYQWILRGLGMDAEADRRYREGKDLLPKIYGITTYGSGEGQQRGQRQAATIQWLIDSIVQRNRQKAAKIQNQINDETSNVNTDIQQ